MANAKAPAACPLGNEGPPGELIMSGAHQASASQGRTRPTSALIRPTAALFADSAQSSHSTQGRAEGRRKSGSSPKRPQPPPTMVTTTKSGAAHAGLPRPACNRASSRARSADSSST